MQRTGRLLYRLAEKESTSLRDCGDSDLALHPVVGLVLQVGDVEDWQTAILTSRKSVDIFDRQTMKFAWYHNTNPSSEQATKSAMNRSWGCQ